MDDLEKSVVQEEKTLIVELTEDDVIGAKLPSTSYNQARVTELKTFLSLRGQDITGNKADLFER